MFLYRMYLASSERAEQDGTWDYGDAGAQYNVIVAAIEFRGPQSVQDLKILYEHYFRATLSALWKWDKKRAFAYSASAFAVAVGLKQSTRLPMVLVLAVHGKYSDAEWVASLIQDQDEFRAAMRVLEVVRHRIPSLR